MPCGKGVEPPRGRGRLSGVRELQLFFGYITRVVNSMCGGFGTQEWCTRASSTPIYLLFGGFMLFCDLLFCREKIKMASCRHTFRSHSSSLPQDTYHLHGRVTGSAANVLT